MSKHIPWLDESLTYLEDWNLWLRYAYDNTFVDVPKTTSLYRVLRDTKTAEERHPLLQQAYYGAKTKADNKISKLFQMRTNEK